MLDSASIVIMGASGNLALTKLLPSLYNLHCNGALPSNYIITGYARTGMSSEDYRQLVLKNLEEHVEETLLVKSMLKGFSERISYVHGSYDSVEDFIGLKTHLEAQTPSHADAAHTVFYLSIPPGVFEPVIFSLRDSGLVERGANSRHSVVVEKPFGYDTDSARKLNESISQAFDEEQVYRIDHYLGKEAIQNLMVLRFANIIFEPVWNSKYVESVTVSWEEDKAIGERGGYFDQAGIIRDVVQNHLLQILALVAMEKPEDLSSSSIAKEKIKVLNAIAPFEIDDVVIGQYIEGVCAGKHVNSYRSEPGVPDASMRDTFALMKCEIDSPRWKGVPFTLRAGKALTKSSTEIIIQFKNLEDDIFKRSPHHANKLIITVQPETGMKFYITNKVPGKGMVLKDVKMDFNYQGGFSVAMPGAYERLLLDAVMGDKTLFIGYEELIQSWKMFTPILKKIDAGEVPVRFYHAGTNGPE